MVRPFVLIVWFSAPGFLAKGFPPCDYTTYAINHSHFLLTLLHLVCCPNVPIPLARHVR